VTKLDPALLSRLVREVLEEVLKGEPETPFQSTAPSDAAPHTPRASEPRKEQPASAERVNPGQAESATPGRRGPDKRPLPGYQKKDAVQRIVDASPARLLQGRTGTRYLTETYLGLRADHAIALDAVESEIAAGWAEKQGWIALKTRCTDHQQFLLHPDEGRRLDDASRASIASSASHDVDLQLIAGDGLSAHALMLNGPPLITELVRAFSAAGFRVGKPLFVKYARIGVQDEIGVLTRAKATVMVVGERPGLGTGDSLSIYTAFKPKLAQDNAEKDCISNVRSLGLAPEAAAQRCTELMRRTFAAGGGGVKLASGG